MQRLRAICAIVAVTAAAACHHKPLHPPPNPPVMMNPVVMENQKPGASDWFVPYPQWAMNHEVEGYTDKPSYAAGETVEVKLSALSTPVQWTMYRTGWYAGLGARAIEAGQTGASAEPLPPTSTWDVPCEPNWPTTFTITLPSDATSGVYAIKLVAGGKASMMTFVVRDDARKADLVFQRSDFTDAMYNNWDGETNRSSYYGNHPQWISLDRVVRSAAGWLYPYSGGYFNYEYSMVRFLEREGYDVTYISNLDVHQNVHALERGKAFLSVGHDEYWSPAMRDEIEGARDRGMHIAIFSSDTCDGVLRFKADDTHAFSVNTLDATAANRARNEWNHKTVDLSLPPDQNPEDTLTGTHYAGWCAQPHPDCVSDSFAKLVETDALTISAPTHPLLRHVALDNGSLPSVMGYEYEARYGGATPLPFDLVTIGSAAAIPASILPFGGPPVVVAYQAKSGARVFNAGSMHWSHALDGWSGRTAFRNTGGERECGSGESDCFDVENAAVQQLTVNVLDDMEAKRGSPTPSLVSEDHPCDWLRMDCSPPSPRRGR